MDELFESSLRDQVRQREFTERSERLSKMKQRPRSVRDILAAGEEGRLYTSKAGADADGHGATRPIDEDITVDATPVEMGRVFYTNEAITEAQAAERAPVPTYMLPLDELDPRGFQNLDEQFPDEATFLKWAAENDATPETIAKVTQVAMEQRENRAQIAHLAALVPTWQQDINDLVTWAKRAGLIDDASLRRFFRNPKAEVFHSMWLRWRKALGDDAAAKAHRTGHLEDVGNQIAHLLPDEPEPTAARQRDEDAAMAEGLMGKLRGTYVPGREVPGERGASISAAGDYFSRTLDLGIPDDGRLEEEATDRSLMG